MHSARDHVCTVVVGSVVLRWITVLDWYYLKLTAPVGVNGLQEDAQSTKAERELTVVEKEEQRAMAYTLEAEEATRMVRNRYGGALAATGLGPRSRCCRCSVS